jgi:hypothetical protein
MDFHRNPRWRAWVLILALSAFGHPSHAQDRPPQPDGGKVLYLVEMIRTEIAEKDTERLIRATLKRDGNLVNETVLTAKAGFFGDPGKARIINGRYVVTQFGGIVDTRKGRIIQDLDQKDCSELLGVEKGQVIYRVYNPLAPDSKVSKERAEQFGDWAFDLEKRTRARPAEKHWSLSGVKSPDRSKAVFHGSADSLWIDFVDGKSKELAKGFLVTHSKYARHKSESRAPILWLDNERTLTQTANGKLVTLDMHGKVEPVCEIAGVAALLDSPRLWLDPKGRIIYSCGRADYAIDVKKKTAARLEEYALGHGFETTVETETRGLRTIYFEGQALGGGLFSPAGARTGPEVIAIWDLGDQGSRRHFSVLWTKLGYAWRGLDLHYGGIIGWAN